MKLTRFVIYFIAYDNTVNSQTVYTMGLLDAIIKASVKQIESGKDYLYYKATKEDPFDESRDVTCFDYGKENPQKLQMSITS